MVDPVADQSGCRSLARLALSLTAGRSSRPADPDLEPVINTTCNYSQVASALNAQTPVAASQLNASPSAQAALRGFLDSSPDQRRQIVEELREQAPNLSRYFELYGGFVVQVANTLPQLLERACAVREAAGCHRRGHMFCERRVNCETGGCESGIADLAAVTLVTWR